MRRELFRQVDKFFQSPGSWIRKAPTRISRCTSGPFFRNQRRRRKRIWLLYFSIYNEPANYLRGAIYLKQYPLHRLFRAIESTGNMERSLHKPKLSPFPPFQSDIISNTMAEIYRITRISSSHTAIIALTYRMATHTVQLPHLQSDHSSVSM